MYQLNKYMSLLFDAYYYFKSEAIAKALEKLEALEFELEEDNNLTRTVREAIRELKYIISEVGSEEDSLIKSHLSEQAVKLFTLLACEILRI